MTAEEIRRAVPPLTLGWRLRLALEWADVTVDEMCEHLGMSRATISRWTHDKTNRPPRDIYLRSWAARCGVDEDWLIRGDESASGLVEYLRLQGDTPRNGSNVTRLDDHRFRFRDSRHQRTG